MGIELALLLIGVIPLLVLGTVASRIEKICPAKALLYRVAVGASSESPDELVIAISLMSLSSDAEEDVGISAIALIAEAARLGSAFPAVGSPTRPATSQSPGVEGDAPDMLSPYITSDPGSG